jgi:phage-related protein
MLALLRDTFDAIKAIYTFIISSIGGFFTYIIDFVKYIIATITNIIDSITDLITDIGVWITDFIQSVTDFLADFFPLLIDQSVVVIVALLNFVVDSCNSCYQSITQGFTESVTVLASANSLTETTYYCLYQSGVSNALTLISCGVFIWLTRRIIKLITFGFINI